MTEIKVVLKIIDCPILDKMIIAGNNSGYEFARNKYMNPPIKAATDANLNVNFIVV